MALFQELAVGFAMEVAELSWQRAPTIGEMLHRMYGVYRRSVWLFMLGHSGYLYLLYVSLAYDLLNMAMVAALSLKIMDIFTKIDLIRKVYMRKEYDEALRHMLNMRIPPWVWLMGPLTYPWLIYLALTAA